MADLAKLDRSRTEGIRPTFDPDQIPTIACFSKAETPLGVDLDRLIGVLQRYVDELVAPVWGTPCRLVRSADFMAGTWAVGFFDDCDDSSVNGYHELTPDGLPFSKVFVRSLVAAGEPVSITASHELAEMLVDPAINLFSSGPRRRVVYAYEVADPVESDTFELDGLPMSDFVYPAYFETFHQPGSAKFDHLDLLTEAFELRPGGYQILLAKGRWTQEFGSPKKASAFAEEDRRHHRSEYRREPKRRCSKQK